jgi:predicted lipid-binding transport protein (Tim44 family)
LDKSALGIPDNSSSNNENNGQNNENNDELIGGLVGGLVGGGIFIGALAFCIYRYRKTSKSSLPIAFQTTTRYNNQQRQRSMASDNNPYPRLSDLPRPMSESTRDVSLRC